MHFFQLGSVCLKDVEKRWQIFENLSPEFPETGGEKVNIRRKRH